MLPDLEVPVPEQFVMPEERRHLYVPGSPECYVGISGDVVGPGLFRDWLDAEVTLRKPTGSAEENMYSFGYIVYNLIYQKETNQIKEDVLNISLDHLNICKCPPCVPGCRYGCSRFNRCIFAIVSDLMKVVA